MAKCLSFVFYVVLLVGRLDLGSPATSMVNKKMRSPDLCKPVVVAHRGASGYVPEHTIGAYALAITMGADYIEPDLVMTKDGHLIARHENELSLTTDIADHSEFANRYKNHSVDGRSVSGWFSEDFTLKEIKTLRAKELLPAVRVGNTRMDGSFEIPTMQELIDLAKGFEYSEKRIIGICPEIKHGTHFQRLGLAMEKPLVDLLHENGYRGPEAPVYIQSFEVSNLKEIKNITDLKLVQLLSSNLALSPYDLSLAGSSLTYGQMATAEGLREVATYAAAVGPDKSTIIPRTANNSLHVSTTFVQDAHKSGLKVLPYTFRAENPYLPVEFRTEDGSSTSLGDSLGEIIAFLATGIDGLFTDQPDIVANYRGTCELNNNGGNKTNVHWLSKWFVMVILSISYMVR